ncbi:hypothetical protein FHS76_004393 [Ochrobactrum daejeonense]|uniref:Uncharacterized protein n=1 Tax=Brucella daejeonensis TaxID=659015 RepID=A0A7W9EPS3_9HYPH|nr:hypothetical protein [Brucella daejeonensis]
MRKPPDFPLSCPSDSLLDDTATEIGVNLATLGTAYRVYQGGIGDPLLSRVTLEPSVLKNPHRHLP